MSTRESALRELSALIVEWETEGIDNKELFRRIWNFQHGDIDHDLLINVKATMMALFLIEDPAGQGMIYCAKLALQATHRLKHAKSGARN